MSKQIILTVFIVLGLGAECWALECANNEFTCADGLRCIKKGFVCDEFPNCLDKTDEDEEFCKTWDYEYEYEEETGGGWLGNWGASDPVGDKDEPDVSLNEIEDSGPIPETDPTPVQEESITKTPPETCSLDQCIPYGPLSYVSGQKYTYKYEVLSATRAWSQNSNQSSSILIMADVIIDVMSVCEMALKIENVVTKYSTSETKGEPALELEGLKYIEREILRFSMIGGEIDTLCPTKDEDLRALNFKRGILSMIQNSMPKLHLPHSKIERDVLGQCEMNYKFIPEYEVDSRVIKTRNIPTCQGRSHVSSMARSIPYNFPEAETAPVPIVSSSSSCEQRLKNGIILFADCKEEHKVIPLSSEAGEVSTTIHQKLTHDFTGFSVFPFSGAVDSRTDILFSHHDHSVSTAGEKMTASVNGLSNTEIINQILDLISSTETLSDTETPAHIFSNLVATMKHFTIEEFKDVYENRKWLEEEKTTFYQALYLVGTSASVRFMTQELPHDVATWSTYLSFIKKPDQEIIEAATDILLLEKRPNEALLAIGTLLHNYCTRFPACAFHEPVVRTLEKFSSILASNKGSKILQKKLETLFALRGLGNAGLALNDDILKAISNKVLDVEEGLEVRVTAIESFRLVPCNVSRTSFESILSDILQDSEVRISSYLGLMRCFNYDVLHYVEDILSKEEVNQVGSFIWTHLTNLQETNSPSKIEIQAILSNRYFQEKFIMDFRKYSKNTEWSGFYDDLNVGASVESNVVFSQDSYVPRSATFNLTADLFGRSFNFLELQTRLEGFEKLIADYLGEMIAPDEKSNKLKPIKNPKIREVIKRSTRRDQILGQEPEISFDVKMFGQDMIYSHLSGIHSMAGYLKNLDPTNLLISLKNGQGISIKKSFIPLDSSYQIATSAGMPLSITLEGCATVDLSARLEADLFKLLQAKGKIAGNLKPSVSIDLKASMVLDGYASKTGVEMDSSFHSSSVIEGNIELDSTRSLSIDFNLPSNNMRIVKVSSKLSLLHGPSQAIQSGILFKEAISNPSIPTENSQECSSFDELLGMRLCYSLKYPSRGNFTLDPKLLVHGPFSYDLVLSKTDDSMSGYKLRYHWGMVNERLIAALLIDTPGSTVSREHRFNCSMNFLKKEISLLVKTPVHSIYTKGRYTWQDDEKRLDATVNFNEREVSSYSLGYKIYDRSGQTVLIPSFSVMWRNLQLIKISGSLEQRQKQSDEETVHYSVNLKFEFDSDFFFGSGETGTGSIKGFVNRKNEEWDSSLDILYNFTGFQKKSEEIRISYNRIMKSGGPPDKVERIWSIWFSEFPYLNCKGKWSKKSFPGSLENSVRVSFGSDFHNPLHEVNMYNNIIFYGGGEQSTFNSTIALKYPKNNLDVVMGVDFYQDIRDINTGFIFQYAKGHAVSSRFHFIESLSGPKELEGNWHLTVPEWLNWSIKGSIKEVGLLTYEFELLASWAANKNIEFSAVYSDRSTRLKHLHEVEMKIKLPSKRVVYTDSTLMFDVTQVVVTCQVKTKTGAKYKVRFALVSQLDDLSAHQRKIEIDVNLPTQTYYWHSEITLGEFVTISNDIHIDRYRDLNWWLQVHKSNEGRTRIKSKFLWDSNRDPHKKAELEINFRNGSVSVRSSITLFGNEYMATWESYKQYILNDSNGNLLWHHNHGGELSWKDDDRILHKITTGASFVVDREIGAEFTAKIYLTTPFQNWANNSANFKYSRDTDRIKAALKSRWHNDEFLDLTYLLTKHISGTEIRGDTKIEILSLINDNLVTLSTGASFNKLPGNLDGNAFIKWDNDRVEFRFEAKDTSGPNDVTATLSTKVLTTLKGYKNLSTFIDLYAVKGSLRLHGSAAWEDLIYELHCNGDLYSAQEYLKGEIILSAPKGESEIGIAKIRVYHDTANHDENLLIMGRWEDKEVNLQGRVSTRPQDFRAELELDTTLKKISHASVVLGHSFKDHYQTIAQVKWNKTRTIGFNIESRMKSLTDFIMSLTVNTPFPSYEEVRAEIRNSFMLNPDVRVHSRVFGQIGDKKYGIGGQYEQGESPKLVVGLELYSPIPDLREIRFDIADLTDLNLRKYMINVQCGEQRSISITTEFEHLEKSLNLGVKSKINLSSFLGPEMDEVQIEGDAKISWLVNTDVSLRAAVMTKLDNYKLFASALMKQDSSGKMQLNLALPFQDLEDFEMIVDYRKVTPWQEGYLKLIATSGHQAIGNLNLFGTLRDITMEFDVTDYKRGSIAYKLQPLDVVRSNLEAKLSLDDEEYGMEGIVYTNEDYFVTKLEAVLIAPKARLDGTKFVIEGHWSENGDFLNNLQIIGSDFSYEGDIKWSILKENDWQIEGTVSSQLEGKKEKYRATLIYENVPEKTFKAAINLTGPDPDSKFLTWALEIQKNNWPYSLKLDWYTSLYAGSSVAIVENFRKDRVEASLTVNLENTGQPFQTYQLKTDLDNRSANDVVDLAIRVEFNSSHQNWDHLLLEGNLRQITEDKNGVLRVHLDWPKMKPITCIAEAKFVSTPNFDLRITIQLDLHLVSYGFLGHVKKPDNKINLNGFIWWKKEEDSKRQQVNLIIDLLFLKDGFNGSSFLKIPMLPGFEKNTAELKYLKKKDFNDISLVVNAGPYVNTFDTIFKFTELPAIEGNVTMSSSKFWEGNPVFLKFSQSSKSDGYQGDYYLEWPMWDLKTETFVREPVKAKLIHNNLSEGREGTFQIESRLTKGKPIILSYTFVFPNRPYILVKLGIAYENIKLELCGERSTTRSQNIITTKSVFELNNILWPFGVAYIEEVFLQSPKGSTFAKTSDRVEIYDLDNNESRSSLSIIRERKESGGRLSIKGKFVGREVELACNYRYLVNNIGADLLISWELSKRMEASFDWKDNSKLPTERSQLLTARISHPLRTVLLEGIMFQQEGTTVANVTFNTDAENPEKTPLRALFKMEKQRDEETDKFFRGTLYISHPSLPTDVAVEGEMRRDFEHPFLFKMLLKYSEELNEGLTVTASVLRDLEKRQFTNQLEIIHGNSNLHAKASGILTLGYETYSFVEDFLYTDFNGTEFKAHIEGGLDVPQKTFHSIVEASERLIDLKMRIMEKSKGHWELLTTSETHKDIPFNTSLQLHHSQPIFTLTIQSLNPNNGSQAIEQRSANPDYLRYVAEKIIIHGGYEDQRIIRFSVKHLEPVLMRRNDFSWIPDADFSLKLNHSRLLSSSLIWRKVMEEELSNEAKEIIGLSHEIRDSASAWIREAAKLMGKEIVSRSKPIIIDLVQVTAPLIGYLKNESTEFKHDFLVLFRSINLTEREKNLKISIEYALANLGESLEKVNLYQKVKAILAKGTLRTYISNLVEKVKGYLSYFQLKDSSSSGLLDRMRGLLSSFASAYDQAAKRWYLSFRNAVADFNFRLREWLRFKWHSLYENYKPHILKTLHVLESATYNLVSLVWGYMNQLGSNIKSMSYVQTIQEMFTYIKSTYDEMSNRTLKDNIRMVYSYLSHHLMMGKNLFVKRVMPFMDDWLNEVEKAGAKLYSFENVRLVVDFTRKVQHNINYLLSKVDFREYLINVLAFSIEHGYTIMTQTAIDAQIKHISAKTNMVWNTDNGEIKLLQKLPFTWTTFNTTPEWDEMLEIPVISPVKRLMFPSTKFSILDSWYKKFNLNFAPETWIPPFQVKGYVIGENHIMTFDGELINFKGSCEYILAVDLIRGSWAVTVQYNKNAPRIINIYSENKVIELSKQFKVKMDGRILTLPYALPSTLIWRTNGAVNVALDSGLQVSWNLNHDVVSVTVPRTSFLNTAGLLGTNNNEATDDLSAPDGKTLFSKENVKDFVDSWKVSPSTCDTEISTPTLTEEASSDVPNICDNLFASKSSPFKYCFYQVNPQPYHEMCQRVFSTQDTDSSSIALAYRERCADHSVPVKLPVNYVRCEYTNASTHKTKQIQEGHTVILRKEEIENSVDIVLLIEMNSCNRKSLQTKHFQRFMDRFNDGLIEQGAISARYAVVAYGGKKPFENPTLVSTDTDIFTSASKVASLLQGLTFPMEDDYVSSSSFDAITYASNLAFRSPVSVMFLLFPCSPCHESDGLDFSTMYHILLNNAATLHVFKSTYFDIDKKTMQQKILGYDRDKAYLAKHHKNNKMGDASLKKQIHPPKEELNLCLPLAIETEGAIFTTEALQTSKKKPVERLGEVVGRRVGQGVRQEYDQNCLCLSTQEVTPLMRCDKWEHGDFSVLQRYGLEVDKKSSFFREPPTEDDEEHENE